MGAVVLIGLRFPHYMRGKRVDEELALARRVQLDLFPTPETLAVDVPFAAKCVPACRWAATFTTSSTPTMARSH